LRQQFLDGGRLAGWASRRTMEQFDQIDAGPTRPVDLTQSVDQE